MFVMCNKIEFKCKYASAAVEKKRHYLQHPHSNDSFIVNIRGVEAISVENYTDKSIPKFAL